MHDDGSTYMLLNHQVTVYTYHIERGTGFRAIVISDFHVARFHPISESIHSLISHLRAIIQQNNANVLFICGDIIHFKLSVRYTNWIDVYTALEELGIETHVIPGNHDRWKNKKVMEHFSPHSNHVHLHPCDLIRISPPQGKQFFLGHDLRNDKRVHTDDKVKKWFRSLRHQFINIIHPDDMLILGHVHGDFISNDRLTKSLMPYSLDLKVFYYGLLVLNSEEEIEISYSYQEGSEDTMII